MSSNKYKKLTLNTLLFLVGTIGSKAIAFFLVPLYTNVLSTSEYGVSDLIFTLSSLLMPVFSLSMGESILFFGLQANDENERDKCFKNGFTFVLLGCLFLIFLSPLFLFYHSLDGYTFFLPAFAVLEIVRTYLKCYVKAKEKNVIYAIDNILYALIYGLLNILFLLVFKLGVLGFLTACILSEGISLVFLLLYSRGITKFFKYKVDKELLKKMLFFSAPLILNSISWTIANSFDKVMLSMMVSDDSVGIYASASKIPTILYTIGNLFSSAWTISAYLEVTKKDTNFYSNVFKTYSLFIIFASSIVIMISRPFMYIYVGESFRESSNYVSILVVASIFQSYSAFFGSIIQSGKKNLKMLISTLTAALLNMVLNYFLILKCNIYGACISTAVSFFVIFILRLIFSRKVVGFPINYLSLSLSLSIIVCQTIFVTLNYKVLIVSIVAIVCLIVINIKAIVDIFSKMFKKFRK